MTAATITSPFDASFDELRRLGFHCLPVAPYDAVEVAAPGKMPAEIVMGSWRGLSNWQRYRDRQIMPPEAELYRHWKGTNIGVVLGSRIGPHQLIAVDIDLTDSDEIDEVLSALPYSPMAKQGAKGLTVFYRGEMGIRSRAYKRGAKETIVDLLTGNQTKQTVMPPSIHPDTGSPYTYLRGPVPPGELPVLDLDGIAELEETLEGLGWDPHAKPPASRTIESQLDGPFAELNALALGRLSEWVPELGLYNLQPKRGGRGYSAVATWRDSTTGRPVHQRKNNLSITSRGIRDFGPDIGYSPLDLVMMATGRNFNDAFEWLHIIMHGEAPVFSEALTAPPEPEQPAEDVPKGGTVFDLQAMLDAKTGEPDTEDDDGPEDDDLPVYEPHQRDRGLTRWREDAPSGLVRDIVSWITRGETKPLPAFATLGAIATIATVIGRQYKTPLNGSTVIYGLGLAPSGGGKNRPLQAPARMLGASGLIDLLGPSRWTAGSVMEKELKRSPLFLCVADEYADTLARMTAYNASGAEKSKLEVMKELFSAGFNLYKTQSMALERAFEAYGPHVSMFAAATPGKFFATLTPDAIESGFFNRFLTVCDEADHDERRATQARNAMRAVMVGADPDGHDTDVPEAIRKALRYLNTRRDRTTNTDLQPSQRARNPVYEPDPERVLANDAAVDVFAAYAEWTRELVPVDHPDYAVFYARSAEIALRVATVLAVSECADPELEGSPITIEAPQMQWAVRFVDWATRSTLKEAKDRMNAARHAGLMERVLDYTGKARGAWIVRRKIIDRFKREGTRRELQEILDTLVDAGRLKIRQDKRADGGGRPTIYYRLVKRKG